MSPKFLFFIVLALFLSTVSAGIIRERRQAYYTGGGVVNNMVSDGLFGGSTSLGWAQVPHVYSPMFSPVFGK
ncbi:Nematode Specific Peptide family, group E [Caenorhabditis elegans]|uniref:Nematode Specific Peptide family, group E n=1 Tax=Caenorhabditis elegans TaxID=6239 RepID=Q9NAJ8_CAEEL|nr:Nematode Specific Peptide family, group E [Caenorhabditis elegans]CAB54404.1 Nematode Specific Peptide family, group E [Caenorhabditis elegans]|eukprot:NP_496696.1 Nematode Specific Peptide family, group E [Caenorhabditis elegans]